MKLDNEEMKDDFEPESVCLIDRNLTTGEVLKSLNLSSFEP